MTLTDEGRRLVDDARAGYGPTASDRERVLSALAARVAAAAASSGGSAAASLSGVAAAKGTIAVVVAVAALGAVSVGILAFHARRRRHATAGDPAHRPRAGPPAGPERGRASSHRSPRGRGAGAAPPRPSGNRERRSPLPSARAPGGSPIARAACPRAAGPRARAPLRRRDRATSRGRRRSSPRDRGRAPTDLAAASRADVGPEPPPDVAGEVALLARAQKALADGDLRRCLRLLDRHEAAFPHGMLAEERAAARIIALCGLGRVETARAELGAFLSRAPSSPLAERVKHACGAAWPAPPARP